MLAAVSLHPGPALAERAIYGDREARAIIDTWAFRFRPTFIPPSHPWWSHVVTFCGGAA